MTKTQLPYAAPAIVMKSALCYTPAMPESTFHIRPARSKLDLIAIAHLFEDYVTALGIDLAFQDFSTELANIPGKYAPPHGELLLAFNQEGEPIGCVGLRPIEPQGCCEMKRLYVAPKGRGLGLGQALVDAIIEEARRIGYREMRLDTLPSMSQALSLYHKRGFQPINAYYDTPLEDTIFLGKPLALAGALVSE